VATLLNSENKGLWYQQNQSARERVSKAKRTGEGEDTTSKKKEDEINLFVDFKKKIALTPNNH